MGAGVKGKGYRLKVEGERVKVMGGRLKGSGFRGQRLETSGFHSEY
jgi:hypothetical protein